MKLLESSRPLFFPRTGSQSDNNIQHQGFRGSQRQSIAKSGIGIMLTKRGAPCNSC